MKKSQNKPEVLNPTNVRTVTFKATEQETGTRIDIFVAAETGMTRSAAAKLAEDERIRVNGKAVPKNRKLNAGDTIDVDIPEPRSDETVAEDIPLDVIYEDSDIIVVNKPSGMVVHPAAGNPDGTLVNALLYHCGDSLSGIGGVTRPGIVHRIDKETSGLIAVAKNDAAHLSLSGQLKDHSMRRVYFAVAVGGIKNDGGTVNAPIGRCPSDRKKMAVIKDPEKMARNAVTHYEVLERYRGFTYIKCELETGRTHQIRVHMSYIGHPLLGDTLYGGGHTEFERENKRYIMGQCLHAGRLTLRHPTTGEIMTFEAPLPEEFVKIIDKLKLRQ